MKKLIILSLCFTALFFANLTSYAQEKMSFKMAYTTLEYSGKLVCDSYMAGKCYADFGEDALNYYRLDGDKLTQITIEYEDIDPACLDYSNIEKGYEEMVFVIKVSKDKALVRKTHRASDTKEAITVKLLTETLYFADAPKAKAFIDVVKSKLK